MTDTKFTPPAPDGTLPPNSPFQHLIGYRKLSMTDGHARFALDLREELLNSIDILHGGVHALLLDNALGAAGCFAGEGLPPRRAVTLNLNVSYLGVPDGKQLIVEGRRVGGGRKIYFSEGTVRDDTGKELARATGTFRYIA